MYRVSDTPTEAPANFASLPPVVQLDDETWHGSGFSQRDVLGAYGMSSMQHCGACQSEDTRCIFMHYFHHIVESDVRIEVVCNVCGKFTLHTLIRL